MLKISEKPCDFVIEDTSSVKLFSLFKVFPLRPLRLCGGLNCHQKFITMQNQSSTAIINNNTSKAHALKFIILLGIVSLFADITYEGARSINGPYLALLGASATTVGIVAGFGELIGHSLRLVSGYISDKIGRYWAITLFGYTLNMLAVPALALAGRWEIAAVLMITERIGKAIRTPARDAMLSHATREIGRGKGFGLHEALDQIGAVLGPLIVSGVLYFKGGYRTSFVTLLIPAIMAISVLMTARWLYPQPRNLEVVQPELETKGFPKKILALSRCRCIDCRRLCRLSTDCVPF